MQIKDKVFVVTGGGSGIGRELVLALVKKGARVAAVDMNKGTLAETILLAGEDGEKISPHVVNITDLKAVEALPEQVIAIHGSVDALINNAGIIQPFVRLKDLTYPQAEKVMDVNFFGPLYMTKTFLPYLLKRPEAHIANVSSMGAFLPVPGQTLYGASKAALKLMTEGLHSELLNTNVHVTVIFPGSIKTNITINSGVMTPGQRSDVDTSKMKLTLPDVAAAVIIAGIERNKYQVYIGQDSKMLSLFTRIAPERAARFIYEQMKSLLG